MRSFRNIFRIALVGLFILSSAVAANADQPALSIYTSDWGLGSTNIGPQIIAALWTDGRIVWSSKSLIEGGRPLKQGKFPPEKLRALLDNLDGKGVFKNKALNQAKFGPDSQFTSISINDGKRRLKMESWHELFEINTNLVATAHGIEVLGSRSRERVMNEQPADYKAYIATWSEIRQAVSELIPKEGQPFEGEVKIKSK